MINIFRRENTPGWSEYGPESGTMLMVRRTPAPVTASRGNVLAGVEAPWSTRDLSLLLLTVSRDGRDVEDLQGSYMMSDLYIGATERMK